MPRSPFNQHNSTVHLTKNIYVAHMAIFKSIRAYSKIARNGLQCECLCVTSYGIINVHGYSIHVCTVCSNTFLYVSGQPLLRDLSNEVAPSVRNKWYALGVQLLDDQDVKVLTSIESDYRGDSETCCTKMLERWLDTVATANWEHLIAGLRSPSVKLNKLANDLATKLGGMHTCMYLLHCHV